MKKEQRSKVVSEIKYKAEKFYLDYLRSIVNGTEVFPKIIPLNKPKSTADFDKLQEFSKSLLENSKSQLGFGYSVTKSETTTRLYGKQTLPDKILFETQSDYLEFLGKKEEVKVFALIVKNLIDNFPVLKEWSFKSPQKIISRLSEDEWNNIIIVCRYFNETYLKAQSKDFKFYLRELPINVHTKFIEERKPLFRELFDIILEKKQYNYQSESFEERFLLKFDQPFIRFRFLDRDLEVSSHLDLPELSVSIDSFEKIFLRTDGIDKIYITENKLCYLTLPPIKNSIAVWGVGFGVTNLKNIAPLKIKKIYYWGDIDVQGLQILSQIRSYFPHTHSFLMTKEILSKYSDSIVSGVRTKVNETPKFLTQEELELYKILLIGNLRLEQEKISYNDVLKGV